MVLIEKFWFHPKMLIFGQVIGAHNHNSAILRPTGLIFLMMSGLIVSMGAQEAINFYVILVYPQTSPQPQSCIRYTSQET